MYPFFCNDSKLVRWAASFAVGVVVIGCDLDDEPTPAPDAGATTVSALMAGPPPTPGNEADAGGSVPGDPNQSGRDVQVPTPTPTPDPATTPDPVTTPNKPPVCKAKLIGKLGCGTPSTLVLDGTQSTDPDGDPLTFKWSKGACPATATIVTPNGPESTVHVPGSKTCDGGCAFELTVSDGRSAQTCGVSIDDVVGQPKLSLPKAAVVACDQGTGTIGADDARLVAFFSQGSAVDACGADLLVSHIAPDQFPVGKTLVAFSATDACGRDANAVVPVHVIDNAAPTDLVCPTDAKLTLDPDTCKAQATFTASADDACVGELQASRTFSFESPGIQKHTYVVADGNGHASMCKQTVKAVDVTAPQHEPAPMRVLWPPNHKYVTLKLGECGTAVDNCGGKLDLNKVGSITSVTSDEPEDILGKTNSNSGKGSSKPNGGKLAADQIGGGDGHTLDDIIIVDSTTVRVRRERAGGRNGRVYTIRFAITDPSGNTTEATCTAGVPHDMGTGKVPVADEPEYTVSP